MNGNHIEQLNRMRVIVNDLCEWLESVPGGVGPLVEESLRVARRQSAQTLEMLRDAESKAPIVALTTAQHEQWHAAVATAGSGPAAPAMVSVNSALVLQLNRMLYQHGITGFNLR